MIIGVTCISSGWVIKAVSVSEQLFTSDTVTIWFPAGKAFIFKPPQKVLYGGPAPPDIFRLAEPSLPPKQLTLNVSITKSIPGGSFIVIFPCEIHPLLSVTV